MYVLYCVLYCVLLVLCNVLYCVLYCVLLVLCVLYCVLYCALLVLCIVQALTGTATVEIPTLDGVRKVPLRLTEIIKPGSTRKIPGEGLPFSKQPTKRGDLVVRFDIVFPDKLPEPVRAKLGDLLPPMTRFR